MTEAWENFILGLIMGLTIATLFFASANADGKELIRVAVVDTGLNLSDKRFKDVLCLSGHQDYTNTGIEDTDGHGTHVAGLIKQYAGDKGGYCLVILKYFNKKAPGNTNTDNELNALIEASRQHAAIVNLSGGGPNYDPREYMVLSQAYDMLLIGAAGNEGSMIKKYPGALGLPNTRCVGAIDANGHRARFSNYGPWVQVWQIGVDILSTLPGGLQGYLSGTSMSTAIETGLEIKRRLNAVH